MVVGRAWGEVGGRGGRGEGCGGGHRGLLRSMKVARSVL